MKKLKWFSGGTERSEQAVAIIDELLKNLDIVQNNILKITLESYRTELKSRSSSTQFILSRMNMDIARAIRKDGKKLSSNQSEKLKKLTAISNIRYGY